MYSEKATKFCEIFTLLLTVCTAVAFSEYVNFIKIKTNFNESNGHLSVFRAVFEVENHDLSS